MMNSWRVACTGAWQGEEYVIKLAYTETPFVDIMRIKMQKETVEVHYRHTVKYGKKGIQHYRNKELGSDIVSCLDSFVLCKRYRKKI